MFLFSELAHVYQKFQDNQETFPNADILDNFGIDLELPRHFYFLRKFSVNNLDNLFQKCRYKFT